MSAIFGIFHTNRRSVEASDLVRMQERNRHYGRDGESIYQEEEIGLGCCISSIKSGSRKENPIYYDETYQITLICDALLYNENELKSELDLDEEAEVATQGLLIKAYLKWGEDCVKHLNGDFAFAIWERRQRRLMIFRDHLGVRPMYYFFDGSTFAFSTDYRALLALSFVPKSLNKVMLYALLSDTYHIDPGITYFEQISRLPQAHRIRVDETGLELKKYWTPGQVPKVMLSGEEEYEKELYAIVEDSINRRLSGCKDKVASELSGGLDSTVVTILANRELKRVEKELEAYSWSPSPEIFAITQNDERAIITELAEKDGFLCRFRESYHSPEEAIESKPVLTDGQRSDELSQIMEEMSSHGIRMVLSGWGGDEGISHRADLFELLFHREFKHFFEEARYLTNGSFLRYVKLMVSIPVLLLRRPYSVFGSQSKGIPLIINRQFQKMERKHCKRDILKLKVNPVKHLESGVTVSRTELTAWIGADYQIQYLYPFLDYRVIDFAMSIPRHLYYKRGMTRYIYRKAFDSILPTEICYNVSKIDIAREKYWKDFDDLQRKAEYVMGLIDKKMFDDYIDWEIVERLVGEGYFKEQSRGSIFTLIKLLVCYDIQRLVQEEKDMTKE